MDRRYLTYGVLAVLFALLAIWLLRCSGQGPAVSREAPPLAPAAEPPTRKAAPKRILAPKKYGLTAPHLLNLDELQANIRKYYPEAEHRAGKEGRVTMALVVAADGSVSQVRVETSGGPDFDEAARKVVLAMRFSPAHDGPSPVAVEITEAIDFQFDRK